MSWRTWGVMIGLVLAVVAFMATVNFLRTGSIIP